MTFIKPALISALTLTLSLSGCNSQTSETSPTDISVPATPADVSQVVKNDKFTNANYDVVQVKHVDLNLDVNFDKKILDGVATLDFTRLDPNADTLIVDTKDLTIEKVEVGTTGSWIDTPINLGADDTILGSALTIPLTVNSDKVRITYQTSPDAEGLQWLAPEQTAGKEHPYLFSQAQALNARTIAPLQDTPAVRITYSATLRVPDGLLPLMSASQDGQNAQGEYTFNMPQPIPSYLLAIAVGDIKFQAINDTIGVYAEDYILEASAEEFSETPLMEDANEALYGPYRWGRYDLLVLPPSFPFGGMENPRLSFLTPTLVAGDKSLTNVVAHELAHSWSGNLVTNSSWIDAWLNEGFTSYVENRVMEDLYGEERALMEQKLALDDLKRDIADAKRPELTQLKLPADIEHPDDAFSQVAYVKGQYFLIFLEERFGREAFDPFLKAWFNDHAFQSVTTEDFITYLHENLHKQNPDALTRAELDEWIYQPGLPSTAKNPQSSAFEKVDAQSASWFSGDIKAADLDTENWSTHEWLHFVNGLPEDVTLAQLTELDETFSLTGTRNAETAFAWYMQTIKADYVPAYPDLKNFLLEVGRGKFIYRLYRALKENDRAEWGERVYAQARPGYHPIAQRRIDDILKEE